MDLHTYLLFIGAVALLVIAPGPDMVYILARTMSQGRRAGMIAVVGVNAGAYVHVTATVLGLSALLAQSSMGFTIIKWIGAIYLIWLGARALISNAGPVSIPEGKAAAVSGKQIFWQGFLTDVLNPKVALFFLAFLPQFVDVKHESLSVTQQLVLLGLTCNVIAVPMNMLMVVFASAATEGLRKRTDLVAWLNRGTGAVFIALGIRLARERL